MANSILPPSCLLPLLLLVLLSNDITLSLAMDCNSSDRAALLKIKEQFGSPAELSSWLPATNCCAWDSGIICSETGRVYLVALFSLNVSMSQFPSLQPSVTCQCCKPSSLRPCRDCMTPFPPSPGYHTLSFLTSPAHQSLDHFRTSWRRLSALSTNSKLTGPIPQSLSRLSNLRYIDLSGNMLTGSIPPGLLHGSFRFLILSNNQFTEEISVDYGNGDIDTIDLSHNQLTVTGNPSFLFDIAKPMTKIDLSWNELEFDMTKVGFPHHLTYLDLNHNKVKGGVAMSLKDLKLQHFNVSYNELCGEIPTGRFMLYHGEDCYVHNKSLWQAHLCPLVRNASETD